MELIPNTTILPALNTTGPGLGDRKGSHRWEFLVAVVGVAMALSVLIALLAKCQVLRRYMASYQHTRLREGDVVSLGEQSGLEVGFSMQGGAGRGPQPMHQVSLDIEEDDDGFIEDNYIQASDRERAERAAEGVRDMGEEEEEEGLDDIQFTIG